MNYIHAQWEEAGTFLCSLTFEFCAHKHLVLSLQGCGKNTGSNAQSSGAIRQLKAWTKILVCSQLVFRVGSQARWSQEQVGVCLLKGGVFAITVVIQSEELSFAEVITANLSGISGNCQSSGDQQTVVYKATTLTHHLPSSDGLSLSVKYANCLHLEQNLHYLKITVYAVVHSPLQMLFKYSIHK